MALDKNLLKVYGLFRYPVGDNSNYYAYHVLDRLYSGSNKSYEDYEIKKIVKPFLSEHSIHPYLVLKNLNENKEEEIISAIFSDINQNLFPNKNFNRRIIERINYPSIEGEFMGNLLSVMTLEKNNEIFREAKKARELFLLYADKQHLEMVLDKLDFYARLYHKEADDGGGLDCSDD